MAKKVKFMLMWKKNINRIIRKRKKKNINTEKIQSCLTNTRKIAKKIRRENTHTIYGYQD